MQVRRRKLGVQLDLGLFLLSVKDGLELVFADIEHHVSVHLDEAAIAIVGEPRVAAFGLERLDGLIVQAQVQDGIHHARHGKLSARANAHQQRVVHRAKLLAHALFEGSQGFEHLLVDLGRHRVAVLKIHVAHLGSDGEAGRHRQPGARHFGEPGAFAAQHVFHLSIAVGGSIAEQVNVFLHH